jgi:hypothetical protein
VKYMLLIYQNPATWRDLPEPDRQAIMSDAGALMAELTGTGEWVGGEALADPSTARTVRLPRVPRRPAGRARLTARRPPPRRGRPPGRGPATRRRFARRAAARRPGPDAFPAR